MNHKRWSDVASCVSYGGFVLLPCMGFLLRWIEPAKGWAVFAVGMCIGFVWAAAGWSDAAGKLDRAEGELEKAKRRSLQ